MKEWKLCLMGLLPFAAMVIVECLDVGLSTIGKAAMNKGMSHFVFVVYSNALATLIFLPFLFIDRITVMQNCVFTGVDYSSPTLASAMSNLIPAFTFLLSVIFRMEKLNLISFRSQIKIMGALVSISGALIVTLYKGPAILSLSKPSSFTILTDKSNWIIGGIFLAIADMSLSIWHISQAAVLQEFPSQMTILAFYYFFGTIQCAGLTLFVEGFSISWILTPDIELISVLYSAVFGSVVTYSVLTWCIYKKGPVFVAMFTPLGIVIAAFLSTVFLGETLHVGSVVGAIVIVVGFYGVIWGQSGDQEKGKKKEVQTLQSSSQQKPLLESHTMP
ncbi:hypothetical protein UlMin_008037 [Ulmus minor]